MTDQGKVMIRQEIPLEDGGLVTNAATNLADMKALQGAVKQGDDVYFRSLVTDRLEVTGGFVVDGASVTIGDGVISARNLVQTGLIITNALQIGNATITPDHIYLPGGTIDALSANLGTVTAGTIIVGDGGITIKSAVDATTGIFIDANQIYCKYGDPAAITVMIDGATGTISASRFAYLIDGIGTGLSNVDGINIGNLGNSDVGNAEAITFLDPDSGQVAQIFADCYSGPPYLLVIDALTNDVQVVGAQAVLSGNTLASVQSPAGDVYLTTGVNSAYRAKISDGRMSAAGVVPIALIDYGSAAVTTGASQAGLTITWTIGNHAGSPTICMAIASNKLINCGNVAGSASGATADWATIDGSSQSGTVTVVGYWL